MSAEQNNFQEQIIALQPQIMAKAVKDEAFRQSLLKDPKQTLERDFGLTIPYEMAVLVHEETHSPLHLVLPLKPMADELRDLSDDELEQILGGRSNAQDSDQTGAAFGNTDHNVTSPQITS